MLDDGLPLDVFHRQIGTAEGSHSGVVEAGDARVLQPGEDALLFLHPAEGGRGELAADDLHRHLAREAGALLLGR